jgi:hypothetical protein
MQKFYKYLLKKYLYIYEKYHWGIVARLQQRASGGVHFTNIYNHRFHFFNDRLNSSDIVIDIASGTGTILKKISSSIKFGYGVEVDDVNLWHANQDLPNNIKFIKGDIFNFDYRGFVSSNKINVGILSHILEHIENVPEFLKQLHINRILICVPSEEHAYADLLKSLNLDYRTCTTHFREYSRAILLEHLESAGYSCIYMGFNQEGEIICEATMNASE